MNMKIEICKTKIMLINNEKFNCKIIQFDKKIRRSWLRDNNFTKRKSFKKASLQNNKRTRKYQKCVTITWFTRGRITWQQDCVSYTHTLVARGQVVWSRAVCVWTVMSSKWILDTDYSSIDTDSTSNWGLKLDYCREHKKIADRYCATINKI